MPLQTKLMKCDVCGHNYLLNVSVCACPQPGGIAGIESVEVERPCCRFAKTGFDYKGCYLPSKDEYGAHGYDVNYYDTAIANYKATIDKYGRL